MLKDERDPFVTRLQELPSSAARLSVLLAVADGMISHVCNQSLAKFDLSLAKFNLLAMLNRQENRSLPQSEIQKRLFVTKQNVAALVKRLLQDGLVECEEDKRDRRSQWVRLTSRGAELLQKALPAAGRAVEDVLSGVGDADKQQLEKLLQDLRLCLAKYLAKHKYDLPEEN